MRADSYIYEIRNLVCSYYNNVPVLRIPELMIPRGILIMLLGKSGSGKSTLLETLGLMNNTISSGEVVFNPDVGPSINLCDLWSNKAACSRASLRASQMSFIFQSTNLMPHFTVLENMLAAHQIKGISKVKALPFIREAMQAVGISDLENVKDVTRLSGGQRQRIAFVRAISSPFSVLFGDEPTGNLDAFNSNELIRILHSKVQDRSKTAIIVTHNIEMALEFADMIVVISRSGPEGCGEIKDSGIFFRTYLGSGKYDWMSKAGDPIRDARSQIHLLMSNNEK